jgi:hypothetical protein
MESKDGYLECRNSYKQTLVAACNFGVAFNSKAIKPFSVEQFSVMLNLSSRKVESELRVRFTKNIKLKIFGD